MKTFFCNLLVIGVLCCAFQSQGQILVKRLNYNMTTFEEATLTLLRDSAFPWYICLDESKLTHQEEEWTRIAMQRWNRGFKDFLDRKPGYRKALTRKRFKIIPEGTLFIDACTNYSDGIIRITKVKQSAGNVATFYPQVQQDVGRFNVLIEMDKRNWDRELFINTMMHELGHALGIPHLIPAESGVMALINSDCEEDKICSLTDKDFEVFLEPYLAMGDVDDKQR